MKERIGKMKAIQIKTSACLIGCMMTGLVLANGYVTWEATNGTNYGFSSGTYWSDGENPETTGSGKAYLVAKGGNYMRTPNATASGSYTFGGDSLTVGIVGGDSGSLLHKTMGAGNPTVTYKSLVLNNGRYDSGTGDYIGNIYGPVTVNATAEAPFIFVQGRNTDYRAIYLRGNISGSGHLAVQGGSALNSATWTYRTELGLFGVNSAFTGTVMASGTNFCIVVGSNTALGNEPASLLADAVKLYNGATLVFNPSVSAPQTANRGITIGNQWGGAISNSAALTLNMPVTGSGPLFKRGAGALTLVGAYTAGDIFVEQGTLNAGGLVCDGNQRLHLPAGSALGVGNGAPSATLTNPEIRPGATLRLACDLDTGTYETLNINGTTADLAFGVKLDLSVAGSTGSSLRFPAIVASSSVSAEALAAILPPVPASGCAVVDMDVEVDAETGGHTLYLTVARVIMLQNGNAYGESWNTSGDWSDGNQARENYHYAVSNATSSTSHLQLRSPADSTGLEQKFPGESLSLYSANATYSSQFSLKSKNTRVDNLRLYEGALFDLGDNWTDYVFNGNISVYGTEVRPVVFSATNGRGINVSASLDGSGTIKLSGSGDSSFVRLSGDNSGFFGTILVDNASKTTTAANGRMYLKFNSENNVGGTAEGASSGIVLQNNGTLFPLQNCELSSASRTLTVKYDSTMANATQQGFVTLENDVTLTLGINGQIMNGTKLVVEGDGTGTLALGGTLSGTGTMLVSNATLRIASAHSLPQASLTFGENVGIEVSGAATGDLGTYGLVCTNSVPAFSSVVKFTLYGFPVATRVSAPVFTVSSGDKVDLAKLNASSPRGWKFCGWNVRNAEIGGNVCKTYSAMYVKPGFVVVLR